MGNNLTTQTNRSNRIKNKLFLFNTTMATMAAFWDRGELEQKHAESGRLHETLLPGANHLLDGLELRCTGTSREEIVDVLVQVDYYSVSYFAWANNEDLPGGRGAATAYYWRELGATGITNHLKDDVFVGRDFHGLVSSSRRSRGNRAYLIGLARLYAYIVFIISLRVESVEESVEGASPPRYHSSEDVTYMAYGLELIAKDIMKRIPILGIKALLLVGELETARSSQEKGEWKHKVEMFISALPTS
jgi:hypothetical protein